MQSALRVIIIVMLCEVTTLAAAQQQPPVTISNALMQAVINHLMIGGTFSDGQRLAQQIIDESQAPAKAAEEEKALRAKIEKELFNAQQNSAPGPHDGGSGTQSPIR